MVGGGCCVRGGLAILDSNLNPPPFCIPALFSLSHSCDSFLYPPCFAMACCVLLGLLLPAH